MLPEPPASTAGPIPVLETARLTLRPYEPSDLDAMTAMFGDREVTAHTFLGWRDREGTVKVLDEYLAFLAAQGYGMFAILDRETGGYVGEAGLFVTPMGPVALRYALARAAWGRGLATEASTAIIDDAFGRLDMESLVAGVILANAGSIRVMEKLGFTAGGMITAAGIEFRLFHLARQTWRARSGAG